MPTVRKEGNGQFYIIFKYLKYERSTALFHYIVFDGCGWGVDILSTNTDNHGKVMPASHMRVHHFSTLGNCTFSGKKCGTEFY